MTGLIGVKRKGGRVCVLADETKTHESRATGQLFAQGQAAGVEIRTARGVPLLHAYTNARPNGPLKDRLGASQAKVLYAAGSRVLFVGSTNFTTSSLANAEASVQISLSADGVNQVTEWWSERWSQGVIHTLGHGSGKPSRARSQGAPRTARPSLSPGPPWAHYAPSSGPAPPWPADQ